VFSESLKPRGNRLAFAALRYSLRASLITLIYCVLVPHVIAQGADDGALAGHGGPIRAILVRTNDPTRVVSAGFDARVIEWDAAKGAARRVLRFHDGAVNALAQAGNCVASAGEDTRIALWCGEGLEPSSVLVGHVGPVAGLAYSPDGMLLASASWDRTVRIWSTTGHEPVRTIDGFAGPVNAVAFLSSAAAVVVGGYDGQLRVIPLGSGGTARTLQLGTPVNAVAVDGEDRIVVAAADGMVRFFSASLQPLAELSVGQGPLNTVVLAPDGKRLAVAGMRTPLTIMATATRQVEHEILGPGLPLWAVAFSPDGRRLVTGGADRAVRVWDAETGRPILATAAEVFDPAGGGNERGARVFRACRACHGLTSGDTNRAGPTLAGLFGRRIATLPGYEFSPALKSLDIVWTPQTVSRLFEIGPAAYTPGTKMPEQRITDPDDRQALMNWLEQATRQPQ
jgi:cytochrome c